MRGHIVGRHALCVAASLTTLALAPVAAHAGIERVQAPKPGRAATNKPAKLVRAEIPRPGRVGTDKPARSVRAEAPRPGRADTDKPARREIPGPGHAATDRPSRPVRAAIPRLDRVDADRLVRLDRVDADRLVRLDRVDADRLVRLDREDEDRPARPGREDADEPARPGRADLDKSVRPVRVETPRPGRADLDKSGRDDTSWADRVNLYRPDRPARVADLRDARQETAAERQAKAANVPPATIQIPSLDIGAGVMRVGTEEGRIAAPPLSASGKVGWFEGGPKPGEPGAAILLGHYDNTTGPAIFYKLSELRPGQRIYVTRKDGERLRFVVTKIATYPKDDFPAAKVYGDPGYPALRLITCAGAFNTTTRHYVDNTVVFARLLNRGEWA
ncbi:class F sortase [Nonomuraea sp. NPDC049152]|uniref:class F sortase n=1 Tax=Nonomuraea sp. NPDC049152 TaxID=3154350 RepID=UPI0033D83147